MDIRKFINLFLIFSFFQCINPHGFDGNTLIQETSNNYWRIDYLVDYIGDGQNLDVLSFDEFENRFILKKINSAGFCESEYRCRLYFNYDLNSLECTPLQLFYSIKDSAWVAAFKLKAGDRLLCSGNKVIEVSGIELLHEKLKVYTLEIKGTHTFLVTRHNIVAHNMLLPCGAIAGLTIPLDIGCGASIGTMFGPVGICTGIVVGGVVGCIVNACIKDRVVEYGLSFKPEKTSKPQEIDNLYHFAKSVEDVLKNTVPGRKTNGRSKLYIKKGGYKEAVRDFEDLKPINVREIKTKKGKDCKVGILSDGRTVIAREDSTDEGKPTLEIQKNGNKIKIRYDDTKN